MDEIEFRQYVATCRTDGCENGGVPIEIQAPAEEPNVICGPCGVPITDLVAG